MSITTAITIFLLGALAYVVLRRLLFRLLFGAAMVVGVATAARLALMADDRLSHPSWLTGGLIGGGVGFVVVGVLSYALIYHALIAADERRDIERAHETAKRRRLW